MPAALPGSAGTRRSCSFENTELPSLTRQPWDSGHARVPRGLPTSQLYLAQLGVRVGGPRCRDGSVPPARVPPQSLRGRCVSPAVGDMWENTRERNTGERGTGGGTCPTRWGCLSTP